MDKAPLNNHYFVDFVASLFCILTVLSVTDQLSPVISGLAQNSPFSSLRHILPVCQKGVIYPLLFALLFLTTSQLGDLSPTYLRPSLRGVVFLQTLQNFFSSSFFSAVFFVFLVK